MMGVEQAVKNVIVDTLGIQPEKVTPEARLVDDLDADDLDLIELTMALEEKFNIEVPDEDAKKFLTVDQVVKYIQEKTGLK